MRENSVLGERCYAWVLKLSSKTAAKFVFLMALDFTKLVTLYVKTKLGP